MDILIVILLIIIIILLFEINGKLPKRDRTNDPVEQAMKKDQERRDSEPK